MNFKFRLFCLLWSLLVCSFLVHVTIVSEFGRVLTLGQRHFEILLTPCGALILICASLPMHCFDIHILFLSILLAGTNL